jgi:rubredoxin
MSNRQFDTYMHAMLWTCTSCGFVYEGGQPKMECPVCESYKTSFIDIPQHIEREVRTEFDDLPPNHIKCREKRLELMDANDVRKKNRVAGRILPAAAGNHMNPSSDDV